MRTVVFIALVAFVSSSFAWAADDMKAFPAAEEGMTRHVINLPKQQDENAFKVELIIGKTVKTDASNSYFFAGTLETETIPGWGFTRYILRKLGAMKPVRQHPRCQGPGLLDQAGRHVRIIHSSARAIHRGEGSRPRPAFSHAARPGRPRASALRAPGQQSVDRPGVDHPSRVRAERQPAHTRTPPTRAGPGACASVSMEKRHPVSTASREPDGGSRRSGRELTSTAMSNGRQASNTTSASKLDSGRVPDRPRPAVRCNGPGC